MPLPSRSASAMDHSELRRAIQTLFIETVMHNEAPQLVAISPDEAAALQHLGGVTFDNYCRLLLGAAANEWDPA